MKSKNAPSLLGQKWDFWLNHPHSKNPEKKSKSKNSYYFIFNCELNDLEYTSNSILDVLGYTATEFDMYHFFSSIHPDDLEYCNTCENNSLQLRDRMTNEELFKFSISYSFRIKTKAGKYITIKQQYQTIESDEYGRMFKNFVRHEKIEDYEVRPTSDFQIIDKFNNKRLNLDAKFNLTKREIEVLGLIHEGYQSKEIATILNISYHTAQTHRKNILSKTASSSLIEVFKKTGR
ncbi:MULTISPECIES: LuxR C-terminal-related transcriptional regulator [unclassified Myroides]|uniref:LuxR C-terminal-related transcriptional regulator n=1 Tax=unclassified Myroides TaxID=2642485 RepID=UPI003D2F6DDD